MRWQHALRHALGVLFCCGSAVAGHASANSLNLSAATVTYSDLYTLSAPPGYGVVATPSWQSAIGGQIAGYSAGDYATQYAPRAMLWTPTTTSGIELHPAGFYSSQATATAGAKQVGTGMSYSSGTHALLWSGSAASFVDLHPNGTNFTTSEAYGISSDGAQQVGDAYSVENNIAPHAALWGGTAASFVDLNPVGFATSVANGSSGTQQVGNGSLTTNGSAHALLWAGTAASVIDLNPVGFSGSNAIGTNGTQQVGDGARAVQGSHNHALLWAGTAASYVDLNPSGMAESVATGILGAQEVGYGSPTANGLYHALVWSGTAASAVDLGAVLPSMFTSSYASSIQGNTVYGYAIDTNYQYHAIAWTVSAPEPAGLSLLLLGGLTYLRRARRR